MKQFIFSVTMSTLFSLSMLLLINKLCEPTKIIAQKEQVEIVEVYQIPGGVFETCLSHKDGTRSLWTNHKLGEVGDKMFIWRNCGQEWIQNPNN